MLYHVLAGTVLVNRRPGGRSCVLRLASWGETVLVPLNIPGRGSHEDARGHTGGTGLSENSYDRRGSTTEELRNILGKP